MRYRSPAPLKAARLFMAAWRLRRKGYYYADHLAAAWRCLRPMAVSPAPTGKPAEYEKDAF